MPDQLQPLVLGLTGNIGSGKSTVAVLMEDMMETAGHPVEIVDADAIVRHLQRPGEPGWLAIVDHYGPTIIDPVTEELDREELARRIFSSESERNQLNRLIHPLVRLEERRLIDEAHLNGSHVLLVVPLLFETGLEEWCDAVIVVTIDPEIRISRLMKSRGMTRDQIEARLAVQLPEQELIQRSTYILDNSGTVKELRAEVQELWEEIIRTFQDR